jgi:hypothetical protein
MKLMTADGSGTVATWSPCAWSTRRGPRRLERRHRPVRPRHRCVETEIPVYNLWRFRDGRAVALRFMVDRPTAFDAAGLDP